MPRLLVLTQTHNIWGGIESWMIDLFPALERAGWDVHFGLAWGARLNSPDRFLRQHVYIKRWKPLDGRVGTPTSRQQAVIAELRRLRPDVVVPIAVGDAIPALQNFRRSGGRTRIMIPVHSSHAGSLADIDRNFNQIDGVGFVSGLLYHWATAKRWGPSPRLFWLRNGVPSPSRPWCPADDGVLRVGYVGRLDTRVKRVQDLIGIFRLLQTTTTPFSFRVAGDGPMAPAVETACRYRRGPTSGAFLGYLPRAELYADVYPKLDCLLLTSEAEGSPLVVIEAMRHGVIPVVSRFFGHAAEGLLAPGVNCLTFRVGDVAEGAACIRRLAESPGLRQKLSSAARASAQSYDTDEMVKGWDHALRSVLATSTRELDEGTHSGSNSFGRLERWGLSPEFANHIRTFFGTRFQHKTGFDEWPGSLNSDNSLENEIRADLLAIEERCSTQLYDLETR